MVTIEIVEIEATPGGTIVEVMRVVDVKDAMVPIKLRIREWLNADCYRDVECKHPEDLTVADAVLS